MISRRKNNNLMDWMFGPNWFELRAAVRGCSRQYLLLRVRGSVWRSCSRGPMPASRVIAFACGSNPALIGQTEPPTRQRRKKRKRASLGHSLTRFFQNSAAKQHSFFRTFPDAIALGRCSPKRTKPVGLLSSAPRFWFMFF